MDRGASWATVNSRGHLKTNLVAGALTSTHFTIRTVMPLLLGVLADTYAFSEGQLGDLGATYSAGATLIALTSVVWMRDLYLRLPVVLFLLVGLGAVASVAFVNRYPFMLATFLMAGIGFGGVYSSMIALLARTDDPNRSFGWQWAVGSLPGVFLLYAIPAVATPTGGVRSTFALIVAANGVMAVASVALPKRLKTRLAAARPVAAGARALPTTRYPLWIGLFGVFAFYLGVTGGWAFLGRIAAQAGLPGPYAGTVLAIGSAASSVVAFVAGEISALGSRRSAMTLAGTTMTIGLAMIGHSPTRVGYAVGTILFIGLSTFVLTFSIGLVARLDTAGRAAGLPAAALGAGSILGPAVAGHVFQAGGARTMLVACGLSLLMGLGAYVIAYDTARQLIVKSA
jgi:predicted MFS family arabinose efflux permease